MVSKRITFIIVGVIGVAFGFSFIARVIIEVTTLDVSQVYSLITGSFTIVVGFTVLLPSFLSLSKQIVGTDDNGFG